MCQFKVSGVSLEDVEFFFFYDFAYQFSEDLNFYATFNDDPFSRLLMLFSLLVWECVECVEWECY